MTITRPQDDAKSLSDATAAAARHDEWLMDEGIRGSFPASDPNSSSQPGSLVNERNPANRRIVQPRRSDKTAFWWLMAGCVIFGVGFLAGRSRR